ncbi:TetR/AcrR family transcriptional regulator [Phenylobacterium deserti]|uniref:TetR/AcrR family transcriptional regulator n=1 Tax=Phenylobacterium deserti TaxID=1914756 RepID=A0A328AVU6_9CAUL|nr:TetR/AcrR family transcriptional regulator [Phenylobacterium deserti]RAK57816.1 TetR/AcrR family transcriptional regulator [Phenylobacterium deserti]
MTNVALLPVGKRERTKVQNRQAILDAARAVFSELGYETATVRDIIRRTGLAAGTFYNYYRSKEEVFAALSDDGARRFAPILKGLRENLRDFEAFVHEAIHAYFQFLAQEQRSWIEKRPPGEPYPHVLGETPEMAAVYAEVRTVIEAALAARQGPAADVAYMTAASIAIARDVGEKMLERRPIDTEAAADFAVTMILRGLRGLAQPKD